MIELTDGTIVTIVLETEPDEIELNLHDNDADLHFFCHMTRDEWREFVRQGNEALGLEAK